MISMNDFSRVQCTHSSSFEKSVLTVCKQLRNRGVATFYSFGPSRHYAKLARHFRIQSNDFVAFPMVHSSNDYAVHSVKHVSPLTSISTISPSLSSSRSEERRVGRA